MLLFLVRSLSNGYPLWQFIINLLSDSCIKGSLICLFSLLRPLPLCISFINLRKIQFLRLVYSDPRFSLTGYKFGVFFFLPRHVGLCRNLILSNGVAVSSVSPCHHQSPFVLYPSVHLGRAIPYVDISSNG